MAYFVLMRFNAALEIPYGTAVTYPNFSMNSESPAALEMLTTFFWVPFSISGRKALVTAIAPTTLVLCYFTG